MTDNLEKLRDIHLPEEGVSFWPLAWGWYVILLGIVALIAIYFIWRIYQTKSKKLYALRQLAKLPDNDISSAVKISEMLRRICVYKYPYATTLNGDQWIEFLNSKCSFKLNAQASALLIYAPYMLPSSQKFQAQDMTDLFCFCRSFIGENL